LLKPKDSLNFLVIAFFALTPLLWFRDGLLIAGGDGPVFLDPVNYLQSFVRYPVTHLNGVMPFEVCLIFPFLLFFKVCQCLGLSLLASEKILFVAYFLGAGMSMNYLMSVVYEGDTLFARIARLIASLFYMFNYFVILLTPLLAQFLAYVLLPLVLGLYMRGIRQGTPLFRRSFLFACALSLLPPAFANPPFLAMIVLILALYTVYDLVIVNRFANLGRAASFILLSAVLYLLFNMWFLAVWFRYFTSVTGVSEALLTSYWNPGSTLNQTVALHGSWAWNEFYFPFFTFYEHTVFKVVVYLLPAAVFVVLLLRINNLRAYFFLLLCFLGIFLAKGRWGLLGNVYAYLYDHCPLFWMFREPHAKFTVMTVTGYAVLFGAAVAAAAERLTTAGARRGWRRAARVTTVTGMTAAAAGFICLSAWPAFTGDIIFDRRGEIPGFRVKVPDDWTKAAEFFNATEGDSRIIELPQNMWASVWLGWEHGYASGGNPVSFLFNKPAIHSPSLNLVSRQFYNQLRAGASPALYKLLDVLHVKYLLQRNDYLWKTLRTDSPQRVKEMVGKQEQIALKETYGNLDVYESSDGGALFGVADSMTGVFGGGRALGAMSMFYDLEAAGLYFFGQLGIGKDREYVPMISRAVLFNTSIADVARDLTGSEYRIVPSTFLRWGDADPAKGWVPANDFDREPFSEAERPFVSGNYIDSLCGVFTASSRPLAMRYEASRAGRYVVLARYAAFAGAKLRIAIDQKQVGGEGDGIADQLHWQEFGTVDLAIGAHTVTLAGEGGRLFVDVIVIVPEETLRQNEMYVRNLFGEKDMRVDHLFAASKDDAGSRTFDCLTKGVYRIAWVPRPAEAGPAASGAVVDGTPAGTGETAGGICSVTKTLEAGRHSLKVNGGFVFARVSSADEASRQTPPRIRYEKAGASRYLLEMRAQPGPYYLFFKEPYDSNWELYRASGSGTEECLKGFDLFSIFKGRGGLEKINKQYVVYGYANAYHMDSGDSGKFLLENRMQRVFEAGVLVSLVSFAASCVIAVCCGCGSRSGRSGCRT